MFKKIFSVLALATTMVACTGDYTDWGEPQSNAQPETIAFGNGSVTEVGLIDFANEAVASSETVKICSVTDPTASDESYTSKIYVLTLAGKDYSFNSDGTMNTADLKSYLESTYGKAPVEREIPAEIAQWVSNGTTAVKTAAAQFTVKAKLDAPVLYDHLYLIGAPSEWNPSCTTLPFTRDESKSIYDAPVFTITVPVADGDTWFAFADDHTVETGDWSQVFGAREGNGKNLIGETGKLTRRTELTDDGSFMIHVDGDAKYMKITVNMLEGTYLIEKINYSQFVYFIGSTDGWSASDQKLESANNDGVYIGFIYVADPNGWGLAGKFQKVAGSWDDQINAGNLIGGMTGVTGTDNIEFPAEGVYYMNLDLTTNSLTATKVTTMGIIGGFNDWAADAAMTWDATNYCFVAENPGITSAGWKFRINSDWGINLGGTVDKLEANGANLDVVGNTVKLYPTRKTSNNIYCTVE